MQVSAVLRDFQKTLDEACELVAETTDTRANWDTWTAHLAGVQKQTSTPYSEWEPESWQHWEAKRNPAQPTSQRKEEEELQHRKQQETKIAQPASLLGAVVPSVAVKAVVAPLSEAEQIALLLRKQKLANTVRLARKAHLLSKKRQWFSLWRAHYISRRISRTTLRMAAKRKQELVAQAWQTWSLDVALERLASERKRASQESVAVTHHAFRCKTAGWLAWRWQLARGRSRRDRWTQRMRTKQLCFGPRTQLHLHVGCPFNARAVFGEYGKHEMARRWRTHRSLTTTFLAWMWLLADPPDS